MEKAPDVIIFNFDGTLADTFDLRMQTWRIAWRSTTGQLFESDLRLKEHILDGLSNREIASRLLSCGTNSINTSQNDAHIVNLCKEKNRLRQIYLQSVKLYPEVRSVLTLLRQKQKTLLVFSRNQPDFIRAVLSQHKVIECFDHIIGNVGETGEDNQAKHLRNLANSFKKRAGEVLFVGDTSKDMEVATAAGVQGLIIDRDFQDLGDRGHDWIPSLLAIAAPEIDHRAEQRLNREYDVLRQESASYQKFRLSVVAFTIAALPALLAFIANSVAPGASGTEGTEGLNLSCAAYCSDAVLILVPFIILIFAAALVDRLSRHTTKLGAYLLVFHECLFRRPGWEYARLYHDFGPRSTFHRLLHNTFVHKRRRGSTRTTYFALFLVLDIAITVYSLFALQALRARVSPEFDCKFVILGSLPDPGIIHLLALVFTLLLSYLLFVRALWVRNSLDRSTKRDYILSWISVLEQRFCFAEADTFKALLVEKNLQPPTEGRDPTAVKLLVWPKLFNCLFPKDRY